MLPVIEAAGYGQVRTIHEMMTEALASLPRKEFFVGDDEDSIRRHIEEQGFVLLARLAGEDAGFVMIDLPGDAERNLGRDLGWSKAHREESAHIDSVCVRPAHRGHGLQKRLVLAAEKRLLGMGIRRYLATVHPDNIASLASFTALGYGIGATKEKYGGLPRNILFKIAGEGEGGDGNAAEPGAPAR